VDDIRAGAEPNLADLVALTEGQKETQGAFKTKKWR
jgi:putative protease